MNLFGANTPIVDEFSSIPSLPVYDAIIELLSEVPEIQGLTSQVSSKAYLDVLGLREPVLLAGVDGDSYFPIFPGIHLVEGEFLRSGEFGAMITKERADRIETRTGTRPSIGIPLLFTSAGGIGFKIREVPLVGIYSYENPGQFMEEIVLLDPQTVRTLASIQVASAEVEVSDDALGLLGGDLDDLFGDYLPGTGESTISGDDLFSIDSLQLFLNESVPEEIAAPEGGDWNFIIIRFNQGTVPENVISRLNKMLEPYGAMAVGWRIAAGNSAILVLLIQTLFNAGIFLVSIAGIIAVVNILLISVFRRTREIGTLRAIGASDGYIRGLILKENCMLSFLAGVIGIIAGILCITIVNRLEIIIPNALLASLLGGTILTIEFLPSVAAFSLGISLVLGFLASLYPVEAAVHIEPVVAVGQG
ncbi:ABC transporter permease [Breznakiella homolactica]|uniref:FtsX-like permease family protein n=1 Tax=Breznakiella homolactica TaxID=2798577 RepID=A0A7T8BC34_9SPIR|nr:FtsX-like permease family protein [Breznakiella homolactica]QQO09813.1 FtsX-like permease family protein [Breznakiella homolactica]